MAIYKKPKIVTLGASEIKEALGVVQTQYDQNGTMNVYGGRTSGLYNADKIEYVVQADVQYKLVNNEEVSNA